MSEPQEAAEQRQLTQRQFLGEIATTAEGPLPRAWDPEGLGDAWAIAGVIAKSKIIPEALRGNPSDVFIVLWQAKELGMSAMDGLQNLHVVKGKIGMAASLMQRRALALPHCERFEVIEADNKHAVVEIQRKGSEARRVSFTEEQAKAAGLIGKGGAWDAYREDMYVWRATSRAARRYFPECLGPVQYTPDELKTLPGDIEAEPSEAELVAAKTQAVIERVQRGRGKGKGVAALLPDAEPEPEEKNVTPEGEHRLADPAGILSTAPAAIVSVDEELARHELRAAEVRRQRGSGPAAATFAGQVEDALSQIAKAPPPSRAQQVLNATTAPATRRPPPEREPGEDDEAAPAPQVQTMSTEVPPPGPVERLSDDQVEALLAQARAQNYRAGGEQAFRDFTSRTFKLRLERIAAAAFPALMEELKADAAVQMKRERA